MRGMRRVLLLIAVILAACSGGPTEPDNQDNRIRGSLIGLVTIGPNCPASREPCPTQPSQYAMRKVLVFDEQRTRQVLTVDIDAHGFYGANLLPGKYVVDVQRLGIDSSTDVPVTVTIVGNRETRLDIRIDTGIR
jgi:hypothetical protein